MPPSKEDLENGIKNAAEAYRLELRNSTVTTQQAQEQDVHDATEKLIRAKKALISSVLEYSRSGYVLMDMPRDLTEDKEVRQAWRSLEKPGRGGLE